MNGNKSSRKLLAVAAGIVLVTLAFVVVRLTRDLSETARPDASAASSARDEVALRGGVDAEPTQDQPASDRLVAEAPDDSDPTVPDSAACTVHGVVVDENDAPLEGVLVRLRGYGGWADGHDVPRLEGGVNRYGWERRTGPSGAFRFDVPVPTIASAVLEIEPDAMRANAEVFFSDVVEFARPALRAGDHDLGAFRLAVTGAVRGTVRGADGMPIAGAEVGVGTEAWNTVGVGAVSDERGEYLVPHVPAGSYGVHAKAPARLPAFVKPVVVERGLVAQGPDLALEPAPTLRGRVTDQAGHPVASARVSAESTSNGPTAQARTRDDGAFTVHLETGGPHRIQIEAAGFAPFGIVPESDAYEPGTDGIAIALAPDVTTRFVVVDEEGAPVENFGLVVGRNESWQLTARPRWSSVGPPPPRSHPGGVVELGARPGFDRFDLYAPGFEELSGEIEHDADAPGTQTLRLSRGCSLVGRAVAGGSPVAGAMLALSPATPQTLATDDGREVVTFLENRLLRTIVETGPDGRFAFGGLDRGDPHALSTIDAKHGVLLLAPVTLERRGENDLGDVELAAPGSIAGELLLPAGVARAGRTIFLGDRRGRITATTGGDGRFRFDAVAPGEHALFVDDAPGVLASGAPFAVEVAPGATVAAVLDCRDRAVSEVALRVDLGGVAPEGYRVDLRSTDETGTVHKLGALDAEGRVRGFVRAGVEAEVLVNVWGYATLVHPTERVPLPAGTQPERAIAFEVGTIDLRLPSDVAIPAQAVLEVEVGGRGYRVRVDGERDVEPSPEREVHEGGRRFVLHLIPAGTHDLAVRLVDHAAEPRIVAKPGGGSEILRQNAYEGAASVAVEPGETAAVALP